MKLADLPLSSTLLVAIRARGYVDATPVQQAVVEADAARDLLVTSQTGSGKTLAFGFAIATALLDEAGRCPPTSSPLALVVAPTRELAQQVARELAWLFHDAGARIATAVGGMDMRRELRTFRDGAAIVVGTPGRLRDHIERGSFDLSSARVVVLDEGDEMLDMGFREELEVILAAAPSERRTLLFSATFPKPLEALAARFMQDPARIRASKGAEPHADIETLFHVVAPREREHAVVNVLRYFDAPTALVFCATREGSDHMCAALVERGFAAVRLSGELSQAERNRAIHAVRERRARVLVATDVAARGLDLPAVALVVHADPPQNAEVLQHRSGRTGRAGRKGTAIVLASARMRRAVERMLKDAHVKATATPVPTPDEIKARDRERLVAEAAALAADVDATEAALVDALRAALDVDALAVALARALQRTMPAPEELPETAAEATTRPSRDRAPPRDDGVPFRVNVGREQRADPKWLLPMLCRRGGITKRDLGRMEIGRRETRFTVNPAVARSFAKSAARPDDKDKNVRIERLNERR